MSSRKLSVAAIAIAALVAVTTLLLGSLAVLNDARERDRQWADLRKELAANADQLSAALALPVWNFDRDQVDKVAESMMADQATYGVVVEAGGKTQARVRTDSWGVAKLDHGFATNGLIVEKRTISFADQQIGRVTLCATPRFLEKRLGAAVIWTSVVIALLDLLLIALAPDSINNSWTCPTSEGCSTNTLLAVVDSVRAAGIFPAMAAGNSGSGCSSISDPPALYDSAVSVGATNSSNQISSFSSRGPITADGSNRLKPDLSARRLDRNGSPRFGLRPFAWPSREPERRDSGAPEGRTRRRTTSPRRRASCPARR